jgi:hypothetical protein
MEIVSLISHWAVFVSLVLSLNGALTGDVFTLAYGVCLIPSSIMTAEMIQSRVTHLRELRAELLFGYDARGTDKRRHQMVSGADAVTQRPRLLRQISAIRNGLFLSLAQDLPFLLLNIIYLLLTTGTECLSLSSTRMALLVVSVILSSAVLGTVLLPSASAPSHAIARAPLSRASLAA